DERSADVAHEVRVERPGVGHGGGEVVVPARRGEQHPEPIGEVEPAEDAEGHPHTILNSPGAALLNDTALLTTEANKWRTWSMSAAALLDRLGRPGDIHLGSARPGRVARLPTGLAALDAALGGGLPRGRVTELAGAPSTG